MAELESSILKQSQLAATSCGSRVLRNNVGAFQDKTGRWVHYGLAPGSSDLIGWTPLLVGPQHIGRTLAIFTALELKRPGAYTEKARLQSQKDFINAVKQAGGLAFFATSPAEVEAAIKQFLAE